MKVKKSVTVEVAVTVEFERDLVPDDEWRKVFYNHIRTENDLAEHFAFNAVLNGITELTMLDGWADKDNSMMKVTVDRDPCYEVGDV